jgi:hypothetical protein
VYIYIRKDAQGGKKTPVRPIKSPWIEVPDDWLDDRYSRDDSYRAFQEYFGLKVKPEVINEYLIGKGILPTTKIEVERFSAKEAYGKLGVDATLGVSGVTRTGGRGHDTIEINKTINLIGKHCSFDNIDSSKVYIRGFGVEHFRRAFPLLDRLGIQKVTAMPVTGPDENPEKYQVAGAYVWSFYGFSNDNMQGTLREYVKYLQEVKGIPISETDREWLAKAIPRMRLLAIDQKHGQKMGKQFLLGMDANGKSTRSIWWNGTHGNIRDRGDEDMRELEKYLIWRLSHVE